MADTYTTDSPEWQALCEGFMQPDVYFDSYFEVETTCGTEIVPCDVIGRTMSVHVDALLNYLEGKRYPSLDEGTAELALAEPYAENFFN